MAMMSPVRKPPSSAVGNTSGTRAPRRRVLLARSCTNGGEDVVEEVKGEEEVGVGFAFRGRGVEGIEGARLRLTRSAVTFAMICPTLLLRPLKKGARLEKT
jgi:hypothetical protein